MKASILFIPLSNIALLLIPLFLLFYIYYRWSIKLTPILYASIRMICQLLLVGFVLVFVFREPNIIIISIVLFIMIVAASWISLFPVKEKRKQLYVKVFFSIVFTCVPVLLLVALGVIRLDPWYLPKYLIPLSGMVFANAMNAISLSAERFYKEMEGNVPFEEARRIAFKTALIPITNIFMAVGIVSIPGMMAGQILAGVDPVVAVRYQIVIMLMLLTTSGLATALFLTLTGNLEKSTIP